MPAIVCILSDWWLYTSNISWAAEPVSMLSYSISWELWKPITIPQSHLLLYNIIISGMTDGSSDRACALLALVLWFRQSYKYNYIFLIRLTTDMYTVNTIYSQGNARIHEQMCMDNLCIGTLTIGLLWNSFFGMLHMCNYAVLYLYISDLLFPLSSPLSRFSSHLFLWPPEYKQHSGLQLLWRHEAGTVVTWRCILLAT